MNSDSVRISSTRRGGVATIAVIVRYLVGLR
jgi:hypothetical protein